MATTRLKILTPDGVFLDQDVDILTLKTVAGEIGIQANRMPFISYVKPSYIKINFSTSDKFKQYWVDGGIVHAEKDNVKLIVEKIMNSHVDSREEVRDEEEYKVEKTQFSQQEIELKKRLKKTD